MAKEYGRSPRPRYVARRRSHACRRPGRGPATRAILARPRREPARVPVRKAEPRARPTPSHTPQARPPQARTRLARAVSRLRFVGAIAGAGSTSGVRLVVGRWLESPLGTFADVMVEDAAGHRTLLAPSPGVADFVAQTYAFDEVVQVPVAVAEDRGPHGRGWRVTAGGVLSLRLGIGRRAPLGWLLRAVPEPVATSTWWAGAVDPVARTVLRGVRTRGAALEGRREWYGATDLHRVTSLSGTWRGTDLGDLAPVDPPCSFGFSSTPRTPGLTRVVTTVELLDPSRGR